MILPILASLIVTASPPAPSCTGTLSGSVRASFTCAAEVVRDDQGHDFLVIGVKGDIEGVPSFVPGSFDVTGLLRPGVYTLEQLGFGKASVAADDRTLYTATKTTGQRGEVTIFFSRVDPAPGGKGAPRVRGTYRARLIPAGGGKKGEVIVSVDFAT
ncbi:MAG: hypothetical protein WCK73_13085 [Deltaproteobacteria bacterium]